MHYLIWAFEKVEYQKNARIMVVIPFSLRFGVVFLMGSV
jgi:hypothetical protein